MTYSDVGGCKEQIEKLREVVETPLLHPERWINHFLFCCLVTRMYQVCEPGYRASQGCVAVWSTRYWQDTVCQGSC